MTELLFESKEDRFKYILEEGIQNCDSLDSNKLDVNELIIDTRYGKKSLLKNYRRSLLSKLNWIKNRTKMMRGINRFHKSTKGKQFHRILGRKIATRDFKPKLSLIESLIALQSLKVHLWIGHKYSSSIDEEVEYELFFDEATQYIESIENKAKIAIFENNIDSFILTDDEFDFLNDVIISTGVDNETSES
jgi:hypothetical protein